MVARTVGDVALTRSGDKGADANVGVWTHSERAYRLLVEQLTPEVVQRHFAAVCRGPVRRYELPNLRALNFVLGDALDGGGSSSLRTDAQGKLYGLAMALVPIEVPVELIDGGRARSEVG
jgi:hypothetical protein